MDSAKKIRLLLVHRDMMLKELASSMSPPMKPQNLSNRMKLNDFRESDLERIAEALNCDLEINFVMRDTGEKI